MNRAILAVLVLLVWGMPARALSITYTDVATASFSYIPATSGVSSISASFLTGPNELGGDGHSAVAFGMLCGNHLGFGQLCFESDKFANIGPVCSFGEFCTASVSLLVSFNPGFAVSFFAFGSGPGGLVSSTIVFAGPDPVPLPAALPLFAGAIGATGFLGWYRKRRTALKSARV